MALRLLLLAVSSATFAFAQNNNNNTTAYLTRRVEQFQVIYEWRQINFTWPDHDAYQQALDTNKYIPANVLISGVKHHNGRLYLSLPRMREGVPTTLAWIPAEPTPKNNTEPPLTPFPSLEMNAVGDCKAFQSVQSFEIDLQGRMWVIDNGRVGNVNRSSGPTFTCVPSLTIVDLTDPNLGMTRYNFPESVVSPSLSYLTDIVVDDTDGGYAYITDNNAENPGIVVYSRADSRSWKFSDARSMRATPEGSAFSIDGFNFNLSSNIDGIALGPRYVNKRNVVDRNVYFSPLSSLELFGVPALVLRNESFSHSLQAEQRAKLVANLGAKTTQTDGMIMDETGYLYFGLLGNCAIAHWDHKTNFGANQETISRDPKFIQWADRFAFDDSGRVHVVVNRLHKYMAGMVDPKAENYRILRSHVGTRSYLYGPELQPVANPPRNTRVRIKTNGAANILGTWSILLGVIVARVLQ